MDRRFEVTVRNRRGRIIERLLDATAREVRAIETQYGSDSRYSVVVAEKWCIGLGKE